MPTEHVPADDLAAVKRAVGGTAAAKRFRIRVVERGRKQAKVSVSLPLALVRAIGEGWRVQGCHRCEQGRGPTVGEVLRALDSGQDLVEIDDDETTVRVWVE